MLQYITRRILLIIPTIVGVSLVLFFKYAMAPVDAITANMDPNMRIETKQAIREKYHLDEPKTTQYMYWLKGVVTEGSLGESFYYKRPVSEVMKDFIPNSFILGAASLILGLIIAVPIGIVSATKQYSFFDKFFTVFALMGISMPSLVKRILLAELEDENDCVDFQNYLDERLIEQEKSLQRLIHEQLQSLSAILINTILNTKVHSDVKLEGSSISSEQLQGQYDMEELPEISNELPEEFVGVLEMFLK